MATYGKLRETRILGQAGTTWHVQLWKKDYTGDPISMDLEGGTPFLKVVSIVSFTSLSLKNEGGIIKLLLFFFLPRR